MATDSFVRRVDISDEPAAQQNETLAGSAVRYVEAVAWELLTFSFRYPESELAEAIVSGEWTGAVREVARALGLDMPADWDSELGAYENRDAAQLLPALRAEATRLFVGASKPAVYPYEGMWRAIDDGVAPHLFVNPHSMEVERFMKRCGLGRPKGTNEPLDYVATECELLQYLCMLECGMIQMPEGLDPADLPGGSAGAAREVFLEKHACVWMPRFAEAVVAETRASFYRAAAMLLTGVMGSF